MASRPSIIACGTRMAAAAMALKFIVGPALMAASSFAIGLRGTLFKIAFVQVLAYRTYFFSINHWDLSPKICVF